MNEYLLVDAMIGITPPDAHRVLDPNITRWFKPSEQVASGATIEEIVAEMDAAGVEHGHLTAWSGDPDSGAYTVSSDYSDETFEILCNSVSGARQRYPGRFKSCIGINPISVMSAVRRLEKAVKAWDFSSCWVFPAQVGLPPNHAVYFPIYAKCVELTLPIKINVGVPGPLRPALVQNPMFLDEVLLAFPELTVVGIHVGNPWIQEVIALLRKYPNFYLMTSGWAPKRVPHEIWEFANTRQGMRKILWASDYPLLTMQRCAREGWELPLSDEAKQRYLRENSIEVFKF